jgi:NAD(P)-dependent dehydrogenase (short-subunit alcohol dehydrogenase family)
MTSLQRFSLSDSTVLITGASSGIGYHLALGLANAGATIIACARREDKLSTLVQEIESAGGVAIAVAMDVCDKSSIEKALALAEEKVGVADVIINNAGIADPKPFLECDENDLDTMMATNFRGAWLVSQLAAKRLIESKKPGSIINVTSILGLGSAAQGQAAYSSSKGALIQMTRSLANELQRYNIRVNAIAPGWFNTDINAQFFSTEKGLQAIKQSPARRAGELDELLGPVIMLASEAGSFVNGVVLPVDGAHHTRLV